jgi:hypothetical protein
LLVKSTSSQIAPPKDLVSNLGKSRFTVLASALSPQPRVQGEMPHRYLRLPQNIRRWPAIRPLASSHPGCRLLETAFRLSHLPPTWIRSAHPGASRGSQWARPPQDNLTEPSTVTPSGASVMSTLTIAVSTHIAFAPKQASHRGPYKRLAFGWVIPWGIISLLGLAKTRRRSQLAQWSFRLAVAAFPGAPRRVLVQ